MDPAHFERSVEAYNVLENVFLLRGATIDELVEKTGYETENINNILNVAEEKGLIDEDPQDRGLVYGIDKRGLAHYWLHLWQERASEGLVMPDKMPDFLYDYCESHFQLEKNGEIREMLVEEFIQGLMVRRFKENLPAWLEELYTELDENYQGRRGPQEHIEYALEE